MTTWFVSRHRGAIEWAARQGIHIDRPVDQLDVLAVIEGDNVIGTLPIHMAAAVRERGARYLHLEISVPRELRGQELDAEQLQALGARLSEFQVTRCDSTTQAGAGQDLDHVCISTKKSGPHASGPKRLDTMNDPNENFGS